jgi:predicted ferric reductase
MKYGLARALLWAALFLAGATAPLLFAYAGPAPAREFWLEVGVALGFVGFGILLLQFLLTGRQGWVAASFGLDSMLQFHRTMGLVAAVFVLSHPVILFLTDPVYLEYLDPRVDLLRALGLGGVTGALIVLLASSLWRLTFRLSYEWWRIVHGVLAIFVIFMGTTHILQVGYYVSEPWLRVLFMALAAGAVGLVIDARVLRPWRMRRRPWRVEEVQDERGDASTLVLLPEGHRGTDFGPGQFAWLTLGDSPFSLQQHPFSFSSSAAQTPGRISFTIKEAGDFSTRARRTEPGTWAWLEGPFGYFVPDTDPTIGCVMIAGGVGITPFRSMLRTFADRNDPRDLRLIYCNTALDAVIFYEELETLKSRLALTVVHVLEEAPDDWDGETGLLDQELLERHLPTDREGYEYFICGPEPLMNIAEAGLRELGLSHGQVLSERFNMV